MIHPKLVIGLHHVTALTADPQKNLNFYRDLLGLRLVKKTVNFDAPDVYHLYYGDEKGTPGTILTFFPFPGMPKGRLGKGQLTTISFSVPEGSLDYWVQRFQKASIPHKGILQRFKERYLSFEDSDGLELELVENPQETRKGYAQGEIPEEFAIRGFYGVTLCEECIEKTAKLLETQLDHRKISEEGYRTRYSSSNASIYFIDLLCHPDALVGISGAGTTHHVAFATADEQSQQEVRKKLQEYGLNVTPIINREYFHSIYFREPGGVLFEVATLPPGFTVDEPLEHLGESLKLPPWEEKNRAYIERKLPKIR